MAKTPTSLQLPETLLDAVQGTHFGITISDMRHPDQPLIYVNGGFTSLTGYKDHEALGRNCRFLQGPDTCQAITEALRHAIKNGQQISTDILNYRKDGTPFWNHLELSPVKNNDGDIIAYCGFQIPPPRKNREDDNHNTKTAFLSNLARIAGDI